MSKSEDRLPWCTNCEVIVVPDDDGNCHVCENPVSLE